MSDRQRHGFVLLLVAGLIAASVVAIVANKTFLGLDLKGGTELVYQGEPTPQTPHVTQAALQRAVNIMDQRVNQLGVSQPNISTAGGSIDVQLPDVQDTARAEAEVGTTAQLFFYDWEANVLTPNGQTVANQLLAQNQTALTVSQGAGEPNEGSMPLYNAVKLASQQPASVSSASSRLGSQYYLFGKGGSAACAAAAKFYDVVQAVAGERCLLGGPDVSVSRTAALADLTSGLPPGVTLAQGQLLAVKPGTVVLQAVPASFSNPPKADAPTTQFYVLKDNVALTGTDITNPAQSTDAGGNPDVEFGFSSKGAKEFTAVTAAIAKRGNDVSGAGSTLQQHFAVALDNLLITVPSIDFKSYPFGVPSSQGAEITGGFTVASAREFATKLRLGALPIGLKLISVKHLSGRG